MFYGLARVLALEADRHVMQQVERMWASRGSLYGDATALDTSTMQVASAQFTREAQVRADQEHQRAAQAGHGHAQSRAEHQQLMQQPEIRTLLNLADLIIAHPDDSTWWKTVFDRYFSLNPDAVASHIEVRNSVRRNRRTICSG